MTSFELFWGVFFLFMLVVGLFLTIHFDVEMRRRNPAVVQHETTKEIRKIMEENNMSYSDEALRNIILENINDKQIVSKAGRLYGGMSAFCADEKQEIEYQLTTLLLNKQYEKDKETGEGDDDFD